MALELNSQRACVQKDVLRYVLPSIAARLGRADRSGVAAALKRSLLDLVAFRLPGQTNRLALIYDPLSDQARLIWPVRSCIAVRMRGVLPCVSRGTMHIISCVSSVVCKRAALQLCKVADAIEFQVKSLHSSSRLAC